MAEFDPDKYLARKKKSEDFDPDKYLASTKPETALQTLGRSSASLVDSALNAITGALDYGAYNLARAAGRTPEQATQETTSPKDVIGRMAGVTGTPGYENAPVRRLGTAVGETVGENVVQPIARATGLPEQDVASMVNTAAMGVAPVIPKVASGTYQSGKSLAQGARDIVGGAVGRGTGYIAEPNIAPVGYQIPSSRAKLRDTVMLPEDVAKFERGQMPYGQMPTEVPIQQLPRNAVERTALKLSGGEIPYQGQAARAFGERLGETYQNPITAAIDIASMFNPYAPGVPLLTAGRSVLAGVQGIADSVLARRGLDPNLPTRLAEYQSGTRPMPGTPPAMPAAGPVAPQPTSTALTVQGPGQQLPPSVIPMPGPQRNVNIEGQSFNLPQQIDVSNSQAARPQQAGPTPQQMAIQKTQEIVAQKQSRQPAQVAGPVAPSPMAPQPRPQQQPKAAAQPTTKVENIRPSNTIRQELDVIDRQSDALYDQAMKERVEYGTPMAGAYQSQLGEFNSRIKVLQKELEAAVKAEKSALRKKDKTLPTEDISNKGILKTSQGNVKITKGNKDRTRLIGELNGKKVKISIDNNMVTITDDAGKVIPYKTN